MSLSIDLPSYRLPKNTERDSLTELQQTQLRNLLEQGLPVEAKPYAVFARLISSEQQTVSEAMVLEQIAKWQTQGLIRRFGLVVKHRNLGFNANAMVVWNIPDQRVDEVAGQLALCDEVSLCYRRPRRLPDWPYNLFCMIHGMDREVVLRQIESICERLSLTDIEKDILFSTRAFKQHGARYGKHLNQGLGANCE